MGGTVVYYMIVQVVGWYWSCESRLLKQGGAAWPQAIKDKAIELTPLGRLAQPDDIASVACFLASDAARFMTGEVVEVNGGFYFD